VQKPVVLLTTCILHILCMLQALANDPLQLYGGVGGVVVFPMQSFTSVPDLGSPPLPVLFKPGPPTVLPEFTIGADVMLNEFGGLAPGLHVGYSTIQQSYSASEQTVIATPEGQIRPAELGHFLNAEFSVLRIEPTIRIPLSPVWSVVAGIPLFIPIATHYTQTMHFTNPAGLRFVAGSMEQTTGSGPMVRSALVVPGVHAGIQALWPVNKEGTLLLGGRINIEAVTGWHTTAMMNTFQPGIQAVFAWHSPDRLDTKPIDTTYVRDTVVMLSHVVRSDSLVLAERTETHGTDPITVTIREQYHLLKPKPPSILSASFKIEFREVDGTMASDARLTTRTIRRMRIVPVIPAVVFGDRQTQIPDRYRKLSLHQSGILPDRYRFSDTVHWHYDILNIIGSRMDRNPGTTVWLRSHFSDDAHHALERCRTIKHYLTETFGIAASRITIDTKGAEYDTVSYVVLTDSTGKLMKPIEVIDTVTERTLPGLLIHPEVMSEAGITQWLVRIEMNGDTLFFRRGEGDVPLVIEWDMNRSKLASITSLQPIRVWLQVEDADGTIRQTEPGIVTVLGEVANPDPSIQNQVRILILSAGQNINPFMGTVLNSYPVADSIVIHGYQSAKRLRQDQNTAPVSFHQEKPWYKTGLFKPEEFLYDQGIEYITGN